MKSVVKTHLKLNTAELQTINSAKEFIEIVIEVPKHEIEAFNNANQIFQQALTIPGIQAVPIIRVWPSGYFEFSKKNSLFVRL